MVDDSPAQAAARADVLLVTGYLGQGGGAERQVVELALRLRSPPLRAAVACLVPPRFAARHGGHYFGTLREAGVEVETLHGSGPAGSLLQLVRLARLIRDRRPLVVHSFSFPQNWRSRLACLAAPGTRMIASERTPVSWKGAWIHTLDRLLSIWTDRIVANADAIRRSLIEEGRLPPEKIVVIPNGVDTAVFRPHPERAAARRALGWGDDAIVLGHVGTMAPHKGQRPLLDVFARLHRDRPELRLVLLGDGSGRAALERRARELGVAHRVLMPGFVDDVAATLGALDVYVHLSQLREGCSNAILEAMACGLPVVATDVGGNRELVSDGETGYLVREGDEDETQRRIERLITDEPLRRTMAGTALERVRSGFSLERMVSSTARLYRELTGATGGRLPEDPSGPGLGGGDPATGSSAGGRPG